MVRESQPMKIRSEECTVEELLAGRFFEIPRFQRPYEWGGTELDEFWSDVFGALSGDYFIGSVVLHRRSDNSFGVVDGQQRRPPYR
jgi:uncharacterized protein with ParB-like and HNH nuclease domain